MGTPLYAIRLRTSAVSQSEPCQPLEVTDEGRLDPAVDRAIRRLLCQCFPADAEHYSIERAWHSTPAFSVVSRDGEQVVGHAGVVVRTIRCGETAATVAGLQNFCVAPQWRRSGLARRVMAAAMDEAARRGIRFGLLFCVPALERYYGSQGWSKLDCPVTMLDEHGQPAPLPAKNIAMQIALAGVPLPPGPIHLHGRDW